MRAEDGARLDEVVHDLVNRVGSVRSALMAMIDGLMPVDEARLTDLESALGEAIGDLDELRQILRKVTSSS